MGSAGASSSRDVAISPASETSASPRDQGDRPNPAEPATNPSREVAAVGRGVTDVAAGDLVYGLNDWFRDGAQAEYCVARAAEVAGKPRRDIIAEGFTDFSGVLPLHQPERNLGRGFRRDHGL